MTILPIFAEIVRLFPNIPELGFGGVALQILTAMKPVLAIGGGIYLSVFAAEYMIKSFIKGANASGGGKKLNPLGENRDETL